MNRIASGSENTRSWSASASSGANERMTSRSVSRRTRARLSQNQGMAEVTPFHGLRYDEAKAGPLADVISPPYDVISDPLRAELYARNPYNVVRVEFGSAEGDAGEGDRYTRARKFLDEWTAKGVLRYDHTRAFYLADHYFELGG